MAYAKSLTALHQRAQEFEIAEAVELTFPKPLVNQYLEIYGKREIIAKKVV